MTILRLDCVAPRQDSRSIPSTDCERDEAPGARVPAEIVGNLVAPVAVANHALMGDLCVAIRMFWRRETSAHAC
jgi:hypothetical protein